MSGYCLYCCQIKYFVLLIGGALLLVQVSHAANYLEKQGAFIEEINAKIWAIDGTELPDARSAAKEAVEVH